MIGINKHGGTPLAPTEAAPVTATSARTWGNRRFSGALLPADATVERVASSMRARHSDQVDIAQHVAIQKRMPFIEALASFLSVGAKEPVTVDTLVAHLKSQGFAQSSAARFVPDAFGRSVLNRGETTSRHGDDFVREGAVRLKVNDRALFMSIAKHMTAGEDELRVSHPMFELDAEVFGHVAQLEPGIIRALEKLATYSSHDVMHALFDRARNRTFEAHADGVVQNVMLEDYRVGFTPKLSEFLYVALMRRAFVDACARYPKLEDVVVRDAEAFVHCVETYRQERAYALAAGGEDPAIADVERDYLISVGLSKVLLFVAGPTSASDPGQTSLDARLAPLFAPYPFVWKNTRLQREARAGGLLWVDGPKRDLPAELAEVGRIYLAGSLHHAAAVDFFGAMEQAGFSEESLAESREKRRLLLIHASTWAAFTDALPVEHDETYALALAEGHDSAAALAAVIRASEHDCAWLKQPGLVKRLFADHPEHHAIAALLAQHGNSTAACWMRHFTPLAADANEAERVSYATYIAFAKARARGGAGEDEALAAVARASDHACEWLREDAVFEKLRPTRPASRTMTEIMARHGNQSAAAWLAEHGGAS